MADSYWQGTADGSTATFAVPFPYISQSHVFVQVNGATMLVPGDYQWLNEGAISFRTNPPASSTVSISRSTSPDSALVSFNNGAVLTAGDLNTSALQAFYRTQELQDRFDTYTNAGVGRYSLTGSNPFVSPDDLIAAAADAVLQSTLAQQLLGASNDISTNAMGILAQTLRVDTLQSALDSLTSGVPGGIGTYLTNETNSRIAGDEATATTIALIGAVSGGGATFTLDTATVYVDGTTSMADKFSGIESTISGNTAAITSEATTRAAADAASATTVTGLTSSVGANAAAIASEATTRATADSANASAITSLTTTVAGHTSRISAQATSISGIEAEYTVKIDANGNVAGYGLIAGGGAPSQFTVLANKFSVIDPGEPGGTPTVPFSISDGVVYMQNVVIGGALIQDATITTAHLLDNAATFATGVESTGSVGALLYLHIDPLDIPDGAATVPVQVTGSMHALENDGAMFDMAVYPSIRDMTSTAPFTYTYTVYQPTYTYPNPLPTGAVATGTATATGSTTAGWAMPGNLISYTPYTSGTAAVASYTSVQNLAPGDYTFACYNSRGTNGWGGLGRVSITALVCKR